MPIRTSLILVVAIAIFVGCEETKNKVADDPGTHTHADGTTHANHGHSHNNPPHGGTVCDWRGGKYHVEFTVNHDQNQATVYILGDDVKSAAPIAAEEINLAINSPKVQIVLKANPQEGDGEGVDCALAQYGGGRDLHVQRREPDSDKN